MKKILISIMLFASNIEANINDGFCNGFVQGYIKGYCFNKTVGCLTPLIPLCPLAPYNCTTYECGYDRGFLQGVSDGR